MDPPGGIRVWGIQNSLLFGSPQGSGKLITSLCILDEGVRALLDPLWPKDGRFIRGLEVRIQTRTG